MKLRHTWNIFARDLAMGPRTMMALWIIVFPLLITFVVRLIFGGLLAPAPQLGVVDLGSSVLPGNLQAAGSIEVSSVDSEAELFDLLESGDLDAGLVLPRGFDTDVRNGNRPPLQLSISGSSLASERVVVAVTTIDLVRGIAGEPAPVEVDVVHVGDAPSVPIQDRLVPLLVLLSVALAGIFIPAAGMIQERSNHTVDAVLITRASVGDFVFAKGLIGFLMSFGIGVLTLVINGGFTVYVGSLLLAIGVGALMSVQIGLLLGTVIKDVQTLFTVWKGGAIVLFAPAVLFLFPGVPPWIARIFPTYYFLGPLYEISVEGASLESVLADLGIGLVICVALAVLAGRSALKMEQRLAAA